MKNLSHNFRWANIYFWQPLFIFVFANFGLAMESKNYWRCEEIEQILAPCKKVPIPSTSFQDRWWKVNTMRKMVSPSLNQGLGDILREHDESVIVEIGCGIGYRFLSEQEKFIIRLQPNIMDFSGLVEENISNIYPLTIGQFCRLISAFPGKAVSRYIGINVFDSMPANEREQSLKAISKTQNVGDKIFIVMDANPDLATIIPEIMVEHSQMHILPYIPGGYLMSEQFYRISAILLPKELNKTSLSMNAEIFEKVLQEEKELRHRGKISARQEQLEWAKGEYGLTVVPLEEYFADKMVKLFTNMGYEAKFYYHTSFVVMNLLEIKTPSKVEQPILYRPISDSLEPVCQWSHKDKNFLARLKHKKLSLPADCDDKWIENLLQNNQRLVGAELLVIEATKK
jgi:hypothetical protein